MFSVDQKGDATQTLTQKAGGTPSKAKMEFEDDQFKFDPEKFKTHTEGIFSGKNLSSLQKFENAASELDDDTGTATFDLYGKLPMCANCQAGLLTRKYNSKITAKYQNIRFRYAARDSEQLPGNLRKVGSAKAETTHELDDGHQTRTIEHSYPKS